MKIRLPGIFSVQVDEKAVTGQLLRFLLIGSSRALAVTITVEIITLMASSSSMLMKRGTIDIHSLSRNRGEIEKYLLFLKDQ